MTTNLARRIIPCLDVRNGQVVKGVQFRNHRVMGGIIELATRYSAEGADELVFYDITASPEGRSVDSEWVSSVAEVIDIPFCVAGGIKSVEDARKVLQRGADKISINTPAVQRPGLINELVEAFGSQCVVVGVDSVLQDEQWVTRHLPIGSFCKKRFGDSPHHILYVAKASRLCPITENRNGLTGQSLPNERGDNHTIAPSLTGPNRVEEAQYDAGKFLLAEIRDPQKFIQQFGRGVRPAP